MMNTYEKMEAFARNVLALSKQGEEDFWKALRASGAFTAKDIEAYQMFVAQYEMMTNPTKFKAIQDAVCAMVYKSATGKELEF